MISTRVAWILSAATVGVYVARRLGPHDFGVLNYAIALTGLLSIIASMNVEQVVIRQLVRAPDHRSRALGNLFVLRLILLAAMGGTLALTLFALDATAETATLCAILACGNLGLVLQGSALHFQATVQSKYIALPLLVACVVNSGVRLAAAACNWPLAVFAWAEASINIVTFSGSLWFYWKDVASPLSWSWNRGELLRLFAAALPLAISGVFTIVDARIDQVMVQHLLGTTSVGHYAIASRLTENWNLLSYLLCASLFPAVITASQISEGAYRKQIHRLYFLLFYSMVSVSALTTLLAPPVVPLLFGPAYRPAVPVLELLVWSSTGNALFLVFSQWAINENRIAWIAWGVGTGVAIKVALNLVLIRRSGLQGVAWSSVLAVPLGMVLTLVSTPAGRGHLRVLARSVLSLPSFRLGEHAGPHGHDLTVPAQRPGGRRDERDHDDQA